MRRFTFFLLLMTLLAAPLLSVTRAGKIEADPNKEYLLSKHRGPWMIMAATFMDGSIFDGRTADEVADELILELRQLGLPAYKYDYEAARREVAVTDRFGRQENRIPLRQIDSVSVIAGNYKDIDDKVAQNTLKWLKRLHPKCLKEGSLVKPTPGRDSAPLSGAFLTLNPLRDPDEVSSQRVDPLLIKLNNGERNSLLENPGKYTLVVARFEGKKVVASGSKLPDIKSFLKDNDLDAAATSARELAEVLNGRYDRRQQNALNNIDAYIWHDRLESIVTVGSFSSPTDPKIEKYRKLFGPKYIDLGGQQVFNNAEHLSVAGFGKDGNETRLWVFEPNAQVMRVPASGR